MATVQAPARTPSVPNRFVWYGIGWEGYQTLLRLIDNRPIRVTYDRGNAEIMSPLFEHEDHSRMLYRMIVTITEELDLPLVSGGSTTFHRQDLDRGLEPDECFYLENAARLRDRWHVDLEIDPPPDLAIEIEITRGVLNRLGIYAALGVPELWTFDGEALAVLRLQDDGAYARSTASAAFPFLPMDEMARFLRARDEPNDTRRMRAFRSWVRDVIVPKVRDRVP